ncbi:hypothetical protein GCM10009613_50720 [Pseudonocardia kongjuensis]|uniref:Luciferase-like domain-containing protein n=1 Tax=Pseudonocardia kongjuensis TaxID=102227 RepID=A0ABN1Y6N2_9PSEU
MIVTAFLAPDPGRAGPDTVLAAARDLERAGAHAVGLLDGADAAAAGTAGGPDGAAAAPSSAFESSTLAARVAVETSRIGVVATGSALYGFPYHAARRLATLDHLAGGRSGWLMRTRTAPSERAAYRWRAGAGRGEELYRAGEFAEIALELWDGWEDGAQWPDRDSGDFKDDDRIRPIGYRSTAFRVDGPLDVPPSPQRRPVLFAEVSGPADVHHLAGPADVVLVGAADPDAARDLVGLLPGGPGRPLVLIAAGPAPGPGRLSPDAAAALVDRGVAAGVALHPGPADDCAELVAGLSPAPRPDRPGLAAALGIEPALAHGGTAA